VPFKRGPNHSLIGSLGLRGVVASLLLTGGVDHSVFDAFVNELLLPQVRAGDVLLLDNLPAHKASAVEESAAVMETIKSVFAGKVLTPVLRC
jgi:hypothetical protein